MIELDDLRETLARVASHAPHIASMPVERRIGALAAAVRELAEPERELGRTLRNELEAVSGLSSEGVAWALDTTLSAMSEASLRETTTACLGARAHGGHGPHSRHAAPIRVLPRGVVVVVLSANVTTASLFALVTPLLLGNAVLAKASHRDDVAARALKTALASVDPELAAALEVVVFEGGDAAREDVLISAADALVVYGSDATVAAYGKRLPRSATFVPHGHGLGVGFMAREVVHDEGARLEAVHRLALDVAAYDQRGCLSPHAVLVEGDADAAREVARELAEIGLAARARTLPRGPLPRELGSAQLAWRSLAVTRGELFEGDGYSTSFEPDGPLRASPGYRNVQVVACRDRRELAAQVGLFGHHLKVIGVAGDEACMNALRDSLVSPLAPRIVAAGTMQVPPFGSIWDGELPETGLVRYAGAP